MADKIFRYFFSYTQYIEGQPPTFGNLCMDLPDRLMGYEDIARVQMMLEEDFSKKFKKIPDYNFKLSINVMMKKIIKEQDPIPKFYGITMMCLPGNELVCHPIPLNIIISTWKKLDSF